MTHQFTKLALCAALAASTVLPVAAQRPGGMGGPGGGASRQEFLAGYLNLTDAQNAQVKSLYDGAQAAMETARGQMESLRTEMNAAIKANGPDATIDRIATALGTLHAQQSAAQAKLQVKFRAILTDEQKTKLDALESRRGEGRGRP
ncbi:MAG: periplasmic heavy metal sensor [Acidobacteria bacterium]|nr:periplasmic heavy metal sensor [Acidobacteriota bacterium]